jgi:hypothetical protein
MPEGGNEKNAGVREGQNARMTITLT